MSVAGMGPVLAMKIEDLFDSREIEIFGDRNFTAPWNGTEWHDFINSK